MKRQIDQAKFPLYRCFSLFLLVNRIHEIKSSNLEYRATLWSPSVLHAENFVVYQTSPYMLIDFKRINLLPVYGGA